MREVWEETGLHVRVEHLIAVYNSPHILLEYPDGNRWQIVALYFAAAPVEGDLRINEESTVSGYFSREEIGHVEIGRFDRQCIDDAFASDGITFVRDDLDLSDSPFWTTSTNPDDLRQ